MNKASLNIHMMTASLTPGDAIGNYMMTSAKIWRMWGAKVELYADYVAPELAGSAREASLYPGIGDGILWYQYSIYTENLSLARNSSDLKIMDFHGIAPPHLFSDYNRHLQNACQKAIDLLPELASDFDYYVVHSGYARDVLLGEGYDSRRLHVLPLCVDADRYQSSSDDSMSKLLRQVEYYLFVGRIVPQKDLLTLIEIFAQINRQRPLSRLFLVGNRQLTPGYTRQIEKSIKQSGLSGKVYFTGQINNPELLAELYRNARLLFVTSEWESFCVPLVEAMFYGTLPVAHTIPPLPEILNGAGLLIDKNQQGAAVDAILNLLADENVYRSLSQLARKRSALYTEASLSRALLEMLAKIAEVTK